MGARDRPGDGWVRVPEGAVELFGGADVQFARREALPAELAGRRAVQFAVGRAEDLDMVVELARGGQHSAGGVPPAQHVVEGGCREGGRLAAGLERACQRLLRDLRGPVLAGRPRGETKGRAGAEHVGDVDVQRAGQAIDRREIRRLVAVEDFAEVIGAAAYVDRELARRLSRLLHQPGQHPEKIARLISNDHQTLEPLHPLVAEKPISNCRASGSTPAAHRCPGGRAQVAISGKVTPSAQPNAQPTATPATVGCPVARFSHRLSTP